MRVFRLIPGGLLAAHAGAVFAATANAPLPVSATVLSICAVSSGNPGGFGQTPDGRSPAQGGARPRVSCSPAAAYRISFDAGWTDARVARGGAARVATSRFVPNERQNDVLVVEIAY